jgi:hypothetical protein
MKKLFLQMTHPGDTPRIHLPGVAQTSEVAEAAD